MIELIQQRLDRYNARNPVEEEQAAADAGTCQYRYG